MKKHNAIEVTNVTKAFKVYYDRGFTLKEKIMSKGRRKYELREVLRGISFEVKKGEAIGLIGKNGCGKSTTLKLLTKIIYPNSGKIELDGRVSSLLELGAGFHPDMSGRENIYMNAAVFGLTHKQIEKRVDRIINFSELEKYIDNPVRTYSSGMYMRLAFSVAINVDADILLIDEILAVGDISFQKKCFEKLNEIKARGTTVVIVSHSLDQIEKMCDKTIWIENGLIKEEGSTREVHEHYLEAMESERLQRFQSEYYAEMNVEPKVDNTDLKKEIVLTQEKEKSKLNDKNIVEEDGLSENNIKQKMSIYKMNFLDSDKKEVIHKGTQQVKFTEMYITNTDEEEKMFFETEDDIFVYLKYEAVKKNLRGTLCLLLYRDDGLYCYGTNTYIEKKEILQLKEEGYLRIKLGQIPFLSGKYYFTLGIHDEQANNYEYVEKAAVLQIFANKGEQGTARINTEWTVE